MRMVIHWAIPGILGGRWVSSVVLEHCTVDRVERHLCRQVVATIMYLKRTGHTTDVPITLWSSCLSFTI